MVEETKGQPEGHPFSGCMIDARVSAEDFDKSVHGGRGDGKVVLSEGGDLEIIVKPGGMVSGRAVAVLTFSVELPNGTPARAQAVTSVACLEAALAMLKGWRAAGMIT